MTAKKWYHGTPRSRDNRSNSSIVLEHKYILFVYRILTFSAGRMCCFMNCFTLVRTSWPVLVCTNNCLVVSVCGSAVLKVLYKKKVTKMCKTIIIDFWIECNVFPQFPKNISQKKFPYFGVFVFHVMEGMQNHFILNIKL